MKAHPRVTRRKIKNPNAKQTLAFRLPPRLVKAIRLAAKKSGMDMTEIAEAVFRRHLRAAVREHVQEYGLPQLEALDKEIDSLLELTPPAPAKSPHPTAAPTKPAPPTAPPPVSEPRFSDIAPTEDNSQ